VVWCGVVWCGELIYLYCISHLGNPPINIDQVLVLNSGSTERDHFGLYHDELFEVGWTESVVHNIRQTVNRRLSNQILSTTPESYRLKVFMGRTYDLSRITGKLSRSETAEYLAD
jgi:hypothetical protein